MQQKIAMEKWIKGWKICSTKRFSRLVTSYTFNDKVLAVLEIFEYIIVYCNEYIPPYCHWARRNNIK